MKDRIAQLNQSTNRKLPQPPPRKTIDTPMPSSNNNGDEKKSEVKLPPIPLRKQQTTTTTDSPTTKPLIKTQTGKGIISKNNESINDKLTEIKKEIDILKYKESTRHIIHQGITCNNCQKNNICGMRFKCFTCQNYNICEDCERYLSYIHHLHDL